MVRLAGGDFCREGRQTLHQRRPAEVADGVFLLFFMVGMGWHMGSTSKTGSDWADIRWYGGCVGAWCERADMACGLGG